MIGFHWLPKVFRLFLVRRFSCGHYPRARNAAEAQAYVADANSVTGRQIRTLFPDAEIKPEKFFGLTKAGWQSGDLHALLRCETDHLTGTAENVIMTP